MTTVFQKIISIKLRTLPASARAHRGAARALSMLLVIAALHLAAASSALAAHRNHRERPREAARKSQSPAKPPYEAACVMEPTTGTVIFARNEHEPWPTASLAKMMVMLIVAEKLQNGSLKLTDPITTSRKAAEMGGSQVYLKEGETFPLADMMKAIIVHSANDATVAVAEYIAGSTEAFVQMMNRKARELGMKDTHYYSVHGLPPNPGQKADVSSAYDEALLARQLVRYPIILKWSAIKTAPFRNGTFTLRNTNHLVFTYNGCDGLKTGFYHQAGFNVVATAHRAGMRLIAVVLGSPLKRQNFEQAAVMLSEGFASYEMRRVAAKGAAISREVAIRNGEVASLKPVFAEDASVFVKRDDAAKAISVSYQLPPEINAPVVAGQKIGTAEISLDGKPVSVVALVAPRAIAARKSLLSRLWGHL